MLGQKRPKKNTKKQRNCSGNLLKQAKKTQHFANLDINSVLDNRKFWQNIKTLSSSKVEAKPTIRLIENDKMIDNKIKIAKIFKKYFVNNIKNLRTLKGKESATITENN